MAKEEEAKNAGHEERAETNSGSAETPEERLVHDLAARIETRGEQEVVSGLSIEADTAVDEISTESARLRDSATRAEMPDEEVAMVARGTKRIDDEARDARETFEEEVRPRKQLSPEQKAKSSERARTYQKIEEQRTQEFGFPYESIYSRLLADANLQEDDFGFADVAPYLVEQLKLNENSAEAQQLRDQLRAAVLEDRKKLDAIYRNPEMPAVWGDDQMMNPTTDDRRQREKQEAAYREHQKRSGVREMDPATYLNERGFYIPHFHDAEGLEKLFASLVDVSVEQIKERLVDREGTLGFEETVEELLRTLDRLEDKIKEQMEEKHAGGVTLGLAEELKQKCMNTLQEVNRQRGAIQAYLHEKERRLGGNPDRKRIGGESD
jgi:hypothetical protein